MKKITTITILVILTTTLSRAGDDVPTPAPVQGQIARVESGSAAQSTPQEGRAKREGAFGGLVDPDGNTTKLNLANRPITDDDLAEISKFSSLETLLLGNTAITDAGIRHLVGLKRLSTIGLINTGVTDLGVEFLADNFDLKILYLSETAVTDQGLFSLKDEQHLETLVLRDTIITDAGVQHLKGLKNLKWLLLGQTRVSEKVRAELREALPDAEITD